MASLTELTAYIRFQLNQLKALNKHHEFEHLTRHFSRLRICSNILPATGPVGSGGDQGKDFETYRTYLSATPIATSTFLAKIEDQKIVFTCSLKDDIITKIKEDTETICKGDVKVDAIYYFCEKDIPVGKRHELQKWCIDQFSTSLEIFDGQALSEQLTDLDVFWIAEEYLDVPSDMYPRFKEGTEKYEKYKEYWLNENQKPNFYSDFSQIKYGLRRATCREESKPDLMNWIRKMETFLDGNYTQELNRRAAYEICVAALRGQNNLTARKVLVEGYFSEIKNLKSLSDLRDATVLLSYCSSAHVYKHFEIEAEKLYQWSRNLIEQIEKEIKNAPGPGTRCNLLMIRGQAGHLQYRDGLNPSIDLNESFDWWARLLEEVPKAPLFPLEYFADLLTIITEFVGEDSRFIELCNKVDELLTKRTSGYVAADKCRDRALAYYDSKKYLLAIKQFHQAKIKWFSAETLRGSLLAMLTLSNCYMRLGLMYAAKYYATGVAYVAHVQEDEKIKPLLSRALFALGDCHYGAGEWLAFVQTTHYALLAHNMHDEDPLVIEKHDDLMRTFTHFVIVRTITSRFNKEIAKHIDNLFANWPIDKDTQEGIESLLEEDDNFWQTVPIETIWESAQEQIYGRPFCDVGEQRCIQWKALGITWTVNFENDHLITSISEELVSTLQIIIADLAGEDLCLLPTKVKINCFTSDIDKVLVEEEPSNKIATWNVTFPRQKIQKIEYIEELRNNILVLAITILSKCSVLNMSELIKKFDASFSQGLFLKVFTVRPYAELYAEFFPRSFFEEINRKVLTPLEPNRDFSSQESSELKWIDSPGPGYSQSKAREYITNRYKNAIKPIRLTLQRCLKDDNFKNLIRTLKKEGYLDWQILLLISNVVVNYRVNKIIPSNFSLDIQRKTMLTLMAKEESTDDVEVPLTIFTTERVEYQKYATFGAIAITWGLVLNMTTPDFDALAQFLNVRYNNLRDDVEHEDFFSNIN